MQSFAPRSKSSQDVDLNEVAQVLDLRLSNLMPFPDLEDQLSLMFSGARPHVLIHSLLTDLDLGSG